MHARYAVSLSAVASWDYVSLLVMQNKFLVTIVDAKEYFKYTPGVLRAHVKPKHLDALRFTLKPVIEDSMGCKLIWSG